MNAPATILRLVLLGMLAVSCGTGPPEGVEITREEYGERWPFTVDRGELACVGSSAVIFTADGMTYAVNDAALDRGYPALDPIWRASPIIPALRVSIAPILDDASRLCR